MDLNDLAEVIHAGNVKRGFFEEPNRNIGEMLALVHSEISEALEAHRKDKFFNKDGILSIGEILNFSSDDRFKNSFEHTTKDSFEDEIADSIIRLLDLAAYKGIDINNHVLAKMRYNSMRPYKHGKKY